MDATYNFKKQCNFILILTVMHFAFAIDANLSTMVNCALQIVNFRLERYVFLVSATGNSLTNEIVASVTNISYALMTLDTIPKFELFSWKTNMYIVIINTVHDYQQFLNLFYRTSVCNSRGMFFVISCDDNALVEMVELSWKYYATRTFILDKTLNIYSYFPYKYGKCGEDLLLEKVYRCSSLTTKAISNMYYAKNLPLQFNKCKFTFEALKNIPYVIKLGGTEEGFEIKMLREVAHYTNTTLVFANHSHKTWGLYTVNGTKTHNMLGDLFDRKIDALVGMVPAATISGSFDITTPHTLDKSLIYVPAGKHVERWRNLQMVYDQKVWVLLFGVFVVVSLALWFGGVVHQNTQNQNHLDYWVLYVVCASCSVLPRLPRLTYPRYVTYVWVCFFFILSSAFQCQLLTFLVKPSFEHEISSFEELIKSEMPIGGYPTIVSVIEDSDNELYQQLTRRWTNCSLELDCVIRTAEERDFCSLHSEKTINYQFSRFLHSSGVAKIKPLRDKEFPFAVCFYLDNDLPYYEKMERLIMGLKENGLFSKWMDNIRYEQKTVVSKETVRLNIHHLIVPFVLLLFGHLIAFCVLLLEIAHYKFRETFYL